MFVGGNNDGQLKTFGELTDPNKETCLPEAALGGQDCGVMEQVKVLLAETAQILKNGVGGKYHVFPDGIVGKGVV